MVKVLLADQESDVAKNFNVYIRSNFQNIKVVSVVSDPNADLVDIINIKKPILIVADVRFFGIASFLKVRDLYERFPDLRFILYGNYQDADYIKKCSEFGVIEHFYKPIKQNEFNKALENAVIYFKKNEENIKKFNAIKESYLGDKILFEKIFLSSLIMGKLKDETEIYYSFKYFGFDLKPPFKVAIARIDHFKTVMLALDEMEKHMLSYNILKMIDKKFLGTKNKAFIESFNQIVIILSGESMLDELVDSFEELKQGILSECGVRVTFGIGRTYDSAKEIWYSYREAEGALLYRFQMGYNSVIHISFVEPIDKLTYRYPKEREDKLIRAISIGEYDYAVSLLKEIFDPLLEASPLPNQYLPKVILNILISINKYLSAQSIDIQNQFLHFFPSKDVFEIGDDVNEAFDYLKVAIKKFCDHIVSFRLEMDRNLVEKGKSYLQDTFYKQISLCKIATELGTTPEYINKLFISFESKNVFDYAIYLRMNKAKQMLKENLLDDEMIAVNVGYDDIRHFRSVFKKFENMSTFEFRQQFKYN